ncbi:response regulator [Amphibacillus jilinensis]|uniref:response regulator n=1 Tax=Amphibacillus jilinensis TaxID=1216008 RepID=UPI000306E9BA|nr:response regulator [Amphibacillus jilinensis]
MTYKVIIVDDEPTTIATIKQLGQWDVYNMEVVGMFDDAQHVIQHLERHQVDLIITDMEMPGLSGVELLNYLKESQISTQTLVISGYDHFDYVKQAIQAQSIDYLLKPINKHELNQALEHVEIELARSLTNNQWLQDIDAKKMQRLKDIVFNVRARFENNHLDQIDQLIAYSLADQGEAIYRDKPLLNKFLRELNKSIEDILYTYNLRLDQLSISYLNRIDAQSDLAALTKIYHDIFAMLIDKKLEIGNNALNLIDVRDYIDRNYSDADISLSKIADEFHVTREYLSRVFKQRYGNNLTEYIIELKMKKAEALIVNDAVKIKHAAEQVGYGDLSYFYRVWKKYFRCTPKELIMSKKANQDNQ